MPPILLASVGAAAAEAVAAGFAGVSGGDGRGTKFAAGIAASVFVLLY